VEKAAEEPGETEIVFGHELVSIICFAPRKFL
jgi:hypothetical protein